MYNCRMFSICTDRIKTRPEISILLFSEVLQFFRRTQFCDGLFIGVFLQPVHKFCMCHTVFDMSSSDIFNLYGIFHTLHQHFWIFFLYNTNRFRNVAIQCIVHSLWIQKDRSPLRKSFYIFINRIIRMQIYLTLLKML